MCKSFDLQHTVLQFFHVLVRGIASKFGFRIEKRLNLNSYGTVAKCRLAVMKVANCKKNSKIWCFDQLFFMSSSINY